MKIIYDAKYNVAYIKLKEKIEEVETIHLSDEVNIDISPDGKLYGIELLNANEQMDIKKGGEIIFDNKTSNQFLKFPIQV